MNSKEIITVYENLSQLTRRMLAAARLRDWDTLRRLEWDCAAQVDVLRNKQPAPALPKELRARKMRLLQSILEDDREIRAITEPWMGRMARLMQDGPGISSRATATAPATSVAWGDAGNPTSTSQRR
jgi:flagellar protein FliT